MFVPIYDDNALRSIRFQYVTVLLIATNVAVHLLQYIGMDPQAVISFAVVPAELAQTSPLGGPAFGPNDRFPVPEGLTLLSYMFFHGNLAHLVGNMLFLWVFGDNVEDALGHLRFLIFYLLCGVLAALAHALVVENTPELAAIGGGRALIGASGAVAGVIAAYLMLHPRVRVWVLAFRFIPLRISAAFALGLWVVMQVLMVLIPQAGPIAWWAHIGGLIAGAVLVVMMRRPGVPLFDKGLSA